MKCDVEFIFLTRVRTRLVIPAWGKLRTGCTCIAVGALLFPTLATAAGDAASSESNGSISSNSVGIPLTEQRINEDPGHPAERPEADAATPVPALAPAKTKSGNEWVVAPIPSYNPSQEFGIKVVAQYIFHPKDEPAATPPSIVALGGFYTQKDSWGVLAAYLGHLKGDKWRPALGGGYMDYHYDYYGNGNEAAEQNVAIPVRQKGVMAFGRLMYRVYSHLYAGLGGIVSQIKTDVGVTLPPGVAVPDTINQYTIGPALQWDSRDNQFFPTKGTLANLQLSYSGGDYSYGKTEFDWNHYQSFDSAPGGVLALRAVVRYAGDDAPFFALSQFGSQNDLRGYINGKYRDHTLVAAQIEWRQLVAKKWIVAAFAGVGEVEPRLKNLRANDVLSSAGLGVRYRLGKTNPVNMRLDWAYGKDGGAWYLSIGEAY